MNKLYLNLYWSVFDAPPIASIQPRFILDFKGVKDLENAIGQKSYNPKHEPDRVRAASGSNKFPN